MINKQRNLNQKIQGNTSTQSLNLQIDEDQLNFNSITFLQFSKHSELNITHRPITYLTKVNPPDSSKKDKQEHRKPFLSYSTLKKINQVKTHSEKSYAKHPQLKNNDLSFINQTESEQFITQTQSQSSLDDSNLFVLEKYEGKSQGEYDEFNENISELDRTVILSKKKKQQKIFQPSVEQKEKQQIQEMKQMLKVLQLSKRFNQVKINKQFQLLIQRQNKQDNNEVEEQEVNLNMKKILEQICIVEKNFQLFEKKLIADIQMNENKKTELIKTINNNFTDLKKQKKQTKSSILKKQHLVYELSSQLEVKRELFQYFQQRFQQFQIKMKAKFDQLQQKYHNTSQDQILQQIKQQIQIFNQYFINILNFLKINLQIGVPLISQKIKSSYIQKLKKHYAIQIKQFQELKNELIKKSQNTLKKSQIFNDKLREQLSDFAQRQALQVLVSSKEQMINLISWIRTIRSSKEIDSGRIYNKALELMCQDPPSNFQFQQFKQRLLQDNIIFLKKSVWNKLLNSAELLSQLSKKIYKNQSKKMIKIEKNNYSLVNTYVNKFQTKISYFYTAFNPSFLNNILQNYNEKKQYQLFKENIIKFIHKKYHLIIKNSFIIQQNSSNVKIFHKLIPKEKVFYLDLRTKNQQKNKKYHSDYQQIPNLRSFLTKASSNNFYSSKQECTSLFQQDIKKISQKSYTSGQCGKIDKTPQIIQNNKISFKEIYSSQDLEQIIYKSRIEQTLCQTQKIDSFQQLFRNVQISGAKTIDQPKYYNQILQNYQSQSRSVSSNLYQNQSRFNNNQTQQQIQQACRIFTLYFYSNPKIKEQLQLNDEQWFFLIYPQYRKQRLDKNKLDEQLTNNILDLVRKSEHYVNCAVNNPLKFGMNFDPFFPHQIDPYRQKVISSGLIHEFHDSTLECNLMDYLPQKNAEWDFSDQTIKQIEASRIREFYFSNYQIQERNYFQSDD